MECFEIEWKGPYSIDRVPVLKVAENFGIYAISQKKGRGIKLLYVGRVYWQAFAKRLTQHKRDWLDRVSGEKVVHFGLVKLPEGKKISFERVRDIEELLIYHHLPPYNTASKRGYLGRELLIINTGKSEPLDKIVSSDEQLLRLIKKAFAKS